MENRLIRKPFQGILNILQFNWHFYLIAVLTAVMLEIGQYFTIGFDGVFIFGLAFIGYSLLVSIAVSWYVYDFTGFYSLEWLSQFDFGKPQKIANINAGFDETSALLQHNFPEASLSVLDFYDAEKHTEVSIKRARRKYPPYLETINIQSNYLPFPNKELDVIFLIFAAHEIRDFEESRIFFLELRRVLNVHGKVVLVEHLRDLPNALAYTFGVFHFFSKNRWQKVVSDAGLQIVAAQKLTPYTNLFIIENGNTP